MAIDNLTFKPKLQFKKIPYNPDRINHETAVWKIKPDTHQPPIPQRYELKNQKLPPATFIDLLSLQGVAPRCWNHAGKFLHILELAGNYVILHHRKEKLHSSYENGYSRF
ncbi:hypothetical protein AVEN_34218-1 [Araneus ventricosus]|uniref:Uncharacterized protein n=1 Tax=Araneus ventricosus TaxID=182803 RepID=A0A4Y2MIP2_ARAVE|nr:hypothetical protein AVEN_34218-1 [Araneus ventricosus]